MNGPTLPPMRQEMQRAFDETNQRARPSDADRERITGALRARLGASVVPDGFVPAAGAVRSGAASGSGASNEAANGGVLPSSAAKARSGLGRGGWLGVVVGTGVVAGAIGFVLGYGMAQRERGATLVGSALVESTVGLDGPASAQALPGAAELPSAAREPHSASPARDASGARAGHELEPSEPRPRTAPALGTERAPQRSSRRESVAAGDAASHRLSFAEVLERLRRANLALRQGQAALALIQLTELERTGGDILREEREVTRALALCAIGDEAGARRVAAPLLAGDGSSIYAPRLDASCARERGP